MELIFHPRCEREALDSWRYYELKEEGLGQRFLAEVDNTLQKIGNNPEYNSFIAAGREQRDLAVRKFPFVIIYQIIDDTSVLIISIHNTKKKPLRF